MKNRDFENKIKRAFELTTPDLKDSVISRATEQKGKAIIMTNTNKTNKGRFYKTLASVAAAAAVFVFAVMSGVYYSSNFRVDSVVSIDVNPSVEIKVSKTEHVLDVTAKNKDGELIIGDMDFKGADLDVTLNALIGSMLKNGYINELANSILISVDNDDADNGALLQAKLTEKVNTLLSDNSFNAAILSQTITDDKDLRTLADTYGITVGKAQLISDIIAVSNVYTFESLVPLSINELNLISEKLADPLTHVEAKGTASDKAYIGRDKALEIAFAHAGATNETAARVECELDFDDGLMVYEIEFDFDSHEYDYDVNAVTGEIVKSQKDYDDDNKHNGANNGNNNGANNGTNTGNNGSNANNNGSTVSTTNIGEDKAKEIALTHAGVDATTVKNFRIELEHDDGVKKYEIEFRAGGFEYDYDINAVTGTVLKSERERDDNNTKPQDTTKPASDSSVSSDSKAPAETAILSRDDALKIAYEHAGVVSTSVYDLEVELDQEKGRQVYEIEFSANGYDYEYEIDASTSEVRKSERERDD